ncbi:MAG: hypothetical protein RJA61_520 [Candidatus Parcubacteria bacterium]|jgi:hypothetical protein
MSVENGVLLIPQAFFTPLKRSNAHRTALQILSYLLTFPSLAIKCFQESGQEITAQEVSDGIQALRAELEPLDPLEFGQEGWQPRQLPAMGAMLPDNMQGKTAGEITRMRKKD